MNAPGTITVEENLAELNRTFDLYWRLRKKSLTGMLQHQVKNFRVFLVQQLKSIAPGAPAIESQNLARLKAGGGMQVSARAKEIVARKFGVVSSPSGRAYMVGSGKRGFGKAQKALIEGMMKTSAVKGGTIQALNVAQEIRLRKSHNLFLASAALFKGDLTRLTYSLTKRGSKLGVMRPASNDTAEQASAEFVWGNAVGKFSVMANEGLQKPKNQAAINRALAATIADMRAYIDRKLSEAARKGLNN